MAVKTVTVTTVATKTGDTVASYNVYTNIPSVGTLVGTMTPSEAASGKALTFSDGAIHNVTAKAVFTAAGESSLSSNIVVVDTSVPYVPSDQPNIVFALTSDVVLPIDVSQNPDGTGGNPMLTQGSDPSNLNGWNTFVKANSNYTALAAGTNIVANSLPFTDIIYVKPLLTLTPGANEYYVGDTGAGDTVGIQSDNSFIARCTGTDVNGNYVDAVASNVLTLNTPILITIIKDTNDDITIEFDNGGPIAVGNSATRRKVWGHGAQGSGITFADVAIGRRISFSAALTGQALTDAKNWVIAGDTT